MAMPRPADPLSPPAAIVRRHDPDRFLTALFAPPDRREALLVLYAFNHELARAREAASEPGLALIRLHWWREVVQGARRRHEVADPLTEAIAAGLLDPQDLLALIAAREIEADPSIPALPEWLAYLRGTAGGLMVAAARLLGLETPERLRDAGAAYGAAGVLRSVPALARQGRCLLPEDVLAAHGMSAADLIAAPQKLGPAGAALGREGWRLLRDLPRRLPRGQVAAALPAVLASRDLRRRGTAERGIGDRLAVTWAGLTGRLPG